MGLNEKGKKEETALPFPLISATSIISRNREIGLQVSFLLMRVTGKFSQACCGQA